MGIPASPFGCTDLNITVSGYRLPKISHYFLSLSSCKIPPKKAFSPKKLTQYVDFFLSL
jgi:hypothetical protein